MSQIPRCDGFIRLTSGATAPYQCYTTETGNTLGTWVFETYTPNDLAKIQEIEMYTHAIFDLIFVLALCFAFYMGFHKGGQR